MSSSAPGGSGSGERSQSFSKFMRRASKVLKRGSSSKDSVPTVSGAQSASRTTGPAESSPAPLGSAPIIAPLGFDPSAVGSSDVTGKPIQEEATPAPSVPAAISQSIRDTKPTNARFATTAAQSYTIQEEKARILFAKYGITLEPGEWTAPSKGDGERVEKKIRMRVHRTCHRCQVTFGPEKVCTNCDHNRCKKCPKFPVRKPKNKGKGLGAGAIPGEYATKEKTKILTMPSRVTGKELARKNPSQRVRRTCHKCDTLFVGRAIRCEGCGHERCPSCPREPAKSEKYAEGYPGDKEETFPLAIRHHRDVRVHVRWTCEKCSTMFKDHEKTCGQCGHERCNECTRQPPRKETALDPTAVERIEKRMKEMDLSPEASAI